MLAATETTKAGLVPHRSLLTLITLARHFAHSPKECSDLATKLTQLSISLHHLVSCGRQFAMLLSLQLGNLASNSVSQRLDTGHSLLQFLNEPLQLLNSRLRPA